jgi:hypothetical protein
MAELSEVTLDHFLIEHTPEQAIVIAGEINLKQYDVIYFELCTDPATQLAHQGLLNFALSNPGRVDRDRIAARDPHLHIAAELLQPGTTAVVIDKDFGLKPDKSNVQGLSLDDIFNMKVTNALHSQLREPAMAMQIEQDILTNRQSGQIGAIVTGALHIEVSNILISHGVDVSQIPVGNAASYNLQARPNWSHFNQISTPFINAIEFALRNGADVEETRAAFYEVLARSRQK